VQVVLVDPDLHGHILGRPSCQEFEEVAHPVFDNRRSHPGRQGVGGLYQQKLPIGVAYATRDF
jgi:hypothetical protein